MQSTRCDAPVVFLMGATACGKTELSIRLAQELGAEIVSVDSALVYKGLNIGTAKPSVKERCGISHHLIDVCEPWVNYSAASFCNDASRLVNEIRNRGNRVLFVGGTMLYFKSLEFGIARLPDADSAIRSEISNEANRFGWPFLHAELAKVDPEAAARIHPNDPQRLQRALEVHRLTGKAMSDLQKINTVYLDHKPYKFALVPRNRSWLHERISKRFHAMLDAGFIQEVKGLMQDNRIHADLPSMRSVGYRQAWEHLSQCAGDEQESSLQWVDKAVAATRQLAKRQLTWLRGMENVNTIFCDELSVDQQKDHVLHKIRNFEVQ